MSKKSAAIFAALMMLGVVFVIAGPLGSVQATTQNETTSTGTIGEMTMTTSNATQTGEVSGDLTAPMTPGKPPFGGEQMGTYTINWNNGWVQINAQVNNQPSQGKVFEGWLVDDATGYRLSTGKLEQNGTMTFAQTMVNPTTYNAIVITEEPENDLNPYPAVPIAGSMLSDPFGQ